MADVPPTIPPADPVLATERCPLCLSDNWRTKKVLTLYGHRVCRKCYYSLANRRQLAFVVDIVFLWIATTVVLLGIYALSPPTPAAVAGFDFASIAVAVIAYVAFALRDGVAGQSPAKLLFGLQVVRTDTLEPTGFGESFIRNSPILAIHGAVLVAQILSSFLGLFSFISTLASFIGLIFLLIMAYQLNRGPRWGDGVAGTKVVRKALRFRVPFDTRGLCCPKCGYDLRGSVSNMCSECGYPITPPTASPA